MTSSQKTILIVDDNFEDRQTYDRYLNKDGIYSYTTIEAETGEEGLELYHRQNPDLILLDFFLPDMNGLEFIQELKTNYARLSPIIMLTGAGNEEIAVQAMKAGVQDYLIKEKTDAEILRFAVRNILEQARLQQLAERNENKFRVSVENMLDCYGIYTSIRARNHKIVDFRSEYLNNAACQADLFNFQQLNNQNLGELVTFYPQAELFDLCCQVVETDEAIFREYAISLENQAKLFEIKINKLEDGFVAVWRDITELKQIEKSLKEREEKFRILVTQAPVGIFQTDCQGECLFVNLRWLEITGLSFAEAMGQGWSKALHPEDRLRIYQEWYESAQSGKEFVSEYRFQSPRGKVTWVSGRAVAIYSDRGEQIGCFGIIVDITERKQAETLLNKQKEQLIRVNRDLKQATSLLQKRNRELDEFTYTVSHDLKAPLRAIANLSTWIEEDLGDGLDENIKHNLELLKNRVGRMHNFIESLLDYARIGREQTPIEAIAVKDLLHEIVDSLSPPPTLVVNIAKFLPTFETQKIALQQVFTNLISNAIKHHHSQTGTIKISVTEDDQFYYFSVSDDGPGISAQNQERIFGIFQTLSGNDSGNSGIGLSIVKKIVESQGGTIELESQVGQGSTFRFSWLKSITDN
ncbi:PAS/PAC Sensor Signal Transduction Histidine Kinase [Stanieria sp. NIES-3757]|nr:PAS/PAC Sensor Signal Transduction Histidine Kinase [Stanieria sp. NIES-3757]